MKSCEANPGTVYLVGAGPGATDLITVRGLRLLNQCDVIVHDALIHPDLLLEAHPDAEILTVAKRGYCIGSTAQESINDLLVRLALEGKSVCRLKCGDPCMFGRGGEEAEVLADAGIPFEFVPGVSSAFGAAAASNIPLTHRDVGQSITFVTGHHDPDSPDCTLHWESLAHSSTVVFYMAVRHIEKIAAAMIAHGTAPDTAMAIIENGTTDRQRVLTCEIDQIDMVLAMFEIQSPAIVIVGNVVRYRNRLTQVVEASLRNSP